MNDKNILKANFNLGFTYTRSTGPIVGHFLTCLQSCKIVGIRNSQGKVIMPPTEFDPETGEELSEFIELKNTGEVISWSWVFTPLKKHPLKEPFAWALILLDGADTNFLHAIKVKSENQMKTGMRVKACWALPPKGSITDIKYFEPI
jgi:hypothetical protein